MMKNKTQNHDASVSLSRLFPDGKPQGGPSGRYVVQGDGECRLVRTGTAHHDTLLAIPLSAVLERPSGDGVRVVSLRHLLFVIDFL